MALLFLFFRKRLCGPLANSRFHHQPEPQHRPNSRLEAAYHRAGAAIQRVVDLVAAACIFKRSVCTILRLVLSSFVPARIYLCERFVSMMMILSRCEGGASSFTKCPVGSHELAKPEMVDGFIEGSTARRRRG